MINELDKKWAYSCYIPLFNVIFCPLTSVKRANSRFCRFHARQGLVVFGLWVFTILTALISQVLSLMLWGVTLLLYIAGLVIVSKGLESKIPIIGHLAMVIPEFYMFKKLTGKSPDDSNIVEEDESIEVAKTNEQGNSDDNSIKN